MKNRGLVLLSIILIISGLGYYFSMDFKKVIYEDMFLASSNAKVVLYDESITEIKKLYRGLKVNVDKNKIIVSDGVQTVEGKFYLVKVDNEEFYVNEKNLVNNIKDIDLEKFMFVRTTSTVYENIDNGKIFSLAEKGSSLEVIDGVNLMDDGTYEYYKIKYKDKESYIYGKYLVFDEASAFMNYSEDELYLIHETRKDNLMGGAAGTLDFYPREKENFENNVMPDVVNAWFLNSYAVTSSNVSKYIEMASETNINAFVVDIKDNTSPGYKSEIFKELSPTNYKYAYKSVEEYQKIITSLKDAGFYVIGRITVFKDSYFIKDHPEYAIMDSVENIPYKHDGQYWPSAYQRDVWEFNVNLAKEAVELMGFNEIQFDYVRFPDRTSSIEKSGIIDFKNYYKESKAEAIQRFLMYATDELHKLDVYVSADVFGESAHTYVTAYGQYWPAISNVVDVISAMPYPDHFNKYEYGFEEPVWTVPYDLLKYWGEKYAMKRQEEIPSPAKLRTWIQVYDVKRSPSMNYTSKEVEAQIKGLFDAGLDDGYMTWNVTSNVDRYNKHMDVYKKEY